MPDRTEPRPTWHCELWFWLSLASWITVLTSIAILATAREQVRR